MTTLEKAKLLADMAENARAAGDTKASIELALEAVILPVISLWILPIWAGTERNAAR